MSGHDPVQVRAAGGVVWRQGDRGVEVMLVHRPRYDDWSFPKGKCDEGEGFAEAAAREVWEETGHRVAFGPELGEIRYRDRKDRSKLVKYWAMTVTGGAFEPNDEVDELRWLPIDEAERLLSYKHDRDLLEVLSTAIA